jgi:DNA repair photolyase
MITGTYSSGGNLVRPSKLTSRSKGGIGKELSDGYALNYCLGCTHGCPFCYVPEILQCGPHTDLTGGKPWGSFLYVREGIEERARTAKWKRSKGLEVMLSSTHDPYLPEIRHITRTILENALPAGVRFCIQTRSVLVREDLQLLAQYPSQVRLQFSLATSDPSLARIIEPRVAPPADRVEVLKEAHALGVPVGVILAPLLPPCPPRPRAPDDFLELCRAVSGTEPSYVYAEALHARGPNLAKLNELLGTSWRRWDLDEWDRDAVWLLHRAARRHNLEVTYWPEHRGDG